MARVHARRFAGRLSAGICQSCRTARLPAGLACGQKEKVQQLHDWLKHGPRLANVLELIVEESPAKAYEQFEVL